MRQNIIHIGASELKYEIRGIAEVARQVATLSGKPIYWENIGDPVQKGEKLPAWMKDIIAEAAQKDASYSYCPTRGLDSTREFLAAKLNARGGVQITADDILFFNGLGDAISKVYGMLRKETRVIGPSPSYPTHSSAEASHAGAPPITYRLLPKENWRPDLEELRNKVRYNESIVGVMLINPDNPTGAVYSREVVEEIVALAREYKLFIVADEIYHNLVFDQSSYTPLSDIIGDVPALSLKGVSKEFPWPGSRCGWIEVYNQEHQPMFRRYVRSILDSKMLEVCSTTLPQLVIPEVMSHAEYEPWLETRRRFFHGRAKRVMEIFEGCPGVVVNQPQGAFYLTVVFDDAVKDHHQLRISDPRIEKFIHDRCPPGTEGDRRFVYELLGAKNICVVPLTSMMCDLKGFRSTLLERDDATFDRVYRSIRESICEFWEAG